VKALIITPTREIALQVSQYFALVTGINPVLLIGGLDSREQRRKLLVERPLVAVGTPGRIREMLEKEWLG
jgi:superfamily II DNA/RNA helicase